MIWDFGGEPIPEYLLASLEQLCSQLVEPPERLKELLELLHQDEVHALRQRLDWVLRERAYPGLPGRRRRR